MRRRERGERDLDPDLAEVLLSTLRDGSDLYNSGFPAQLFFLRAQLFLIGRPLQAVSLQPISGLRKVPLRLLSRLTIPLPLASNLPEFTVRLSTEVVLPSTE